MRFQDWVGNLRVDDTTQTPNGRPADVFHGWTPDALATPDPAAGLTRRQTRRLIEVPALPGGRIEPPSRRTAL